jgi:very-short-patch-repair endonuclease
MNGRLRYANWKDHGERGGAMEGSAGRRRPTLNAREIEAKLALLAAHGHDRVTRRQLLEAGLTADMVSSRVTSGRLRVTHRGVYATSAEDTVPGNAMAAVLACGDGSAISHATAASLWQLHPRQAATARIDVVSTRGRCRRPGLRVHRVRALPAAEVTRLNGIPITTPERTLLDLAGSCSARDLERALSEALVRRLTTPTRLGALLTRHPRRHGGSRLRALLDGAAAGAPPRSQAERWFRALVRRAQLPDPEGNVFVEGYEVDFYLRDARLVVEVDGTASHRTRRSFESDRRRDAVLAAAGIRVMRVTWRQLRDEPEAVVARLAAAIARGV